jgi:hypothetical protein
VVSTLGVRSRKLSIVCKRSDGCSKFIFWSSSGGILSRWFRLHLQSLHPLRFQAGLTSGRRPVVKIIAKSLSQHDKKYVVPTPLCGIRVRERKRRCRRVIFYRLPMRRLSFKDSHRTPPVSYHLIRPWYRIPAKPIFEEP